MMYYFRRMRRWFIKKLLGKTEVCLNMTIHGAIEYGGRHGGVINENNTFSEYSKLK